MIRLTKQGGWPAFQMFCNEHWSMGENLIVFFHFPSLAVLGISERQQSAATKSMDSRDTNWAWMWCSLGCVASPLQASVSPFRRGGGWAVAELPHRTGVGVKGPAPLQGSDWTWCRMHRVWGQGLLLHLPPHFCLRRGTGKWGAWLEVSGAPLLSPAHEDWLSSSCTMC